MSSAKKKTNQSTKRTRPTEISLPTADVTEFEPLARKRLSQMAYDYVRSGGADEITMRENRAGFGRLRL
jgi:4-hydroxymandelate oxidase